MVKDIDIQGLSVDDGYSVAGVIVDEFIDYDFADIPNPTSLTIVDGQPGSPREYMLCDGKATLVSTGNKETM
jgi:hypothetical protein